MAVSRFQVFCVPRLLEHVESGVVLVIWEYEEMALISAVFSTGRTSTSTGAIMALLRPVPHSMAVTLAVRRAARMACRAEGYVAGDLVQLDSFEGRSVVEDDVEGGAELSSDPLQVVLGFHSVMDLNSPNTWRPRLHHSPPIVQSFSHPRLCILHPLNPL